MKVKSLFSTVAIMTAIFAHTELYANNQDITVHRHRTLTITNGSGMPISPGVLYITNSEESASEPGTAPSAGFIQLCQTGNPAARLQELSNTPHVGWTSQTPGPILPGETVNVQVPPALVSTNSGALHFEAMYGMSKDVCSKIDISTAHAITGFDSVTATGAFTDPALPEKGMPIEDICSSAPNAVTCLRMLSQMRPVANRKIRVFPGYLPSVVTALESLYRATGVQPLLIPTSSGAVKYKLSYQ